MQLWWSGDDCRKGNGYGIVPTIALSRFHAARVLLLVEPADGLAARHLDGLIALSYYCIPAVLTYFMRKDRDTPISWVFWMFRSLPRKGSAA
jgi:hypothetical protein